MAMPLIATLVLVGLLVVVVGSAGNDGPSRSYRHRPLLVAVRGVLWITMTVVVLFASVVVLMVFLGPASD